MRSYIILYNLIDDYFYQSTILQMVADNLNV